MKACFMRKFSDTLAEIIEASKMNVNQISKISGFSNTYLTKLIRKKINHPGKDKIAIGKNYIYAGMWWMVLFPGMTLILLVVAINLSSDWLRDEMNPKLARQA